MRRVLLLTTVLALGACHDRRSFDDRYDRTANEIEQRGAALDRQATGNAIIDNNDQSPTPAFAP